MSWGERSCKNYGKPCPYNPTMDICNVSCEHYEWDLITEPDSKLPESTKVEAKEGPVTQDEPKSGRKKKEFIDLDKCTNEELVQIAVKFKINMRFRKTRREVITKLRKYGPFYRLVTVPKVTEDKVTIELPSEVGKSEDMISSIINLIE